MNLKHQRALQIAKDLAEKNGCTLLYLTEYGSTLYGTNSETSDVDYKGVFVSDVESLLLKTDKYNLTFTSGNDSLKNNESDIDLQLYSIHMFMDLLEKGEGSAIEILFSVFRDDTIVCADPSFKKMCLENYPVLVSKKLNAFFGYCLGQTKKYGIKGERLNELESIIPILESYAPLHKLSAHQHNLENMIDFNKYEFISFVKGLNGSKNEEVTYLEILGRKFVLSNTCGYVLERLQEIQKQYGDRTKKASEGIDKKALSHAYRIVMQIEELAYTGMIMYPLTAASEIKAIKYCDMSFEDYQELLITIGSTIDELKGVIEKSKLPDSVDRDLLNKYILEFVKEHA